MTRLSCSLLSGCPLLPRASPRRPQARENGRLRRDPPPLTAVAHHLVTLDAMSPMFHLSTLNAPLNGNAS